MKRVIFETENHRIMEIPDETGSMEMLKGDCYNPEVNPDVDPEVLRTEESNFEALVYREGVFGYVLERKCPTCGAWEHLDSCWGFVGSYSETDGRFTHYIVDEMKAQIKAAK